MRIYSMILVLLFFILALSAPVDFITHPGIQSDVAEKYLSDLINNPGKQMIVSPWIANDDAEMLNLQLVSLESNSEMSRATNNAINLAPALSLTKDATEANFNAAGVTLHYTLVATNAGDVTLTDVNITDAKLGTLTCSQPVTLEPLATLTCTGIYQTTQTDVNAGKVDNTANASGMFEATPVNAAPASESVPALQNPHLSLTKVATELNFNAAGVTLHYTLEATNDGNVTLTSVSITDAKLGTLTCTQPVTLAPSAKLTCTGTYLTTQADVNAGKVDNTANANGMFGLIPVAAAPASESVPAIQNAHLSLTKVATELNFNAAAVTLHYTLVATNDGNATLTSVSITDAKLGTLTCTQPVTLAPLATLTCTGTYLTTQADVNAGKVDNTANASGMFGLIPVAAAPASESVPAIQNPLLTLIKTAVPMEYDHEGQVINYSFRLTNSGNVTLTNPFTVIDNKTTNEFCPATPTFLDPGQFITCTASYTIKRSDMTHGSVTNIATATGKFGASTITSNPGSVTVTTPHPLTYYYLPIVQVPYPPGVQVVPVSYNYESHEKLYIIGEVLNNTANPITWVKVVANLFDADDKLLATANNYLWPVDLPAFEKGCFKISMNIPINWSYYQFQSLTYDVSNTSSGLSIITHSGSLKPNNDFEIIGQVRNNGNLRSNEVSVSGTLYNIHNEPVGCDLSVVTSTDLNPGQVSSFQIIYNNYYRNYSDVTSYKLRVAGELP